MGDGFINSWSFLPPFTSINKTTAVWASQGQTRLIPPLDKPLEWAIGFFFGNTELSLELWTVIAGISGFYD
jgi:hypothetical protein